MTYMDKIKQGIPDFAPLKTLEFSLATSYGHIYYEQQFDCKCAVVVTGVDVASRYCMAGS
jgi:hypothetical protein